MSRALAAELLTLLPALPREDALLAEAAATPATRIVDQAPFGHVRVAEGLRLTLDHPACGNRIDRAMWAMLGEALDVAQGDLTLAGEGADFCLGTLCPAPVSVLRAYLRVAPSITVLVQGGCAGGALGLLLAGRVLAAPDAWFALDDPAPASGALTALIHRIGAARAAELVAGRRIDAATALGWGLVDALV